MSSGGNVVDSKIVELSLNNKDFENNARTSISTLDKLKDALKFDKSYKAFDDINSSIKNVNTKTLLHGIQELDDSFGALARRSAVFTTISNAVSSLQSKLTSMVKSITIDPISAGWDKYAQKTTAVQTIMAATAKDFDDQKKQMEAVNKQLEKLMWFTDETSYNFVDMVDNIGKFTSNSIPLEQAVTSMQGISTWAAISGQNAQAASRAMYNLAQAIGVGSVKLIDWRSVENANMSTAEFKETAIETAVELGTLTKVSEDAYKTLAGHEVSVRNFTDALKDEWFTAEVLNKTLSKYGKFTDELYKTMEKVSDSISASDMLDYIDNFKKASFDWEQAAEDTGLSAGELREELERLSSEELEFGRKAFVAAQQAKTFEEAIGSVQDAASSAWLETFELMFGDYLEAQEYFTKMSNDLWEVFVGPVAEANETLEKALEKEGTLEQKDWELMKQSGLANEEFAKRLRLVIESHDNLTKTIEDNEEAINTAIEAGIVTKQDLLYAYASIFGKDVQHQVDSSLKSQIKSLYQADEAFKQLYDDVHKHSDEDLGSVVFGDNQLTEGHEELEKSLDTMLEKLGLSQENGEELVNTIIEIGDTVGTVSDEFSGLSTGSEDSAEAVAKTIESISKAVNASTESTSELRQQIDELAESDEEFKQLYDTVKTFSEEDLSKVIFGDDKLTPGFEDLEKTMDQMLDKLDLGQDSASDLVSALSESTSETKETVEIIDEMTYAITQLDDETLKHLGYTQKQIDKMREYITTAETASETISEVGVKTSGKELWMDALYNSTDLLIAILAVLQETWSDVFPPATEDQMYDIIKGFNEAVTSAKEFVQTNEDLRDMLRGVFSVFDLLIGAFLIFRNFKKLFMLTLLNGMTGGLVELGGQVGRLLQSFRKWANETKILQRSFDFLIKSGNLVGKLVNNLFNSFLKIPIVDKNLKRLKSAFTLTFKDIKRWGSEGIDIFSRFFDDLFALDEVSLKSLSEVFSAHKDEIVGFLSKFPGFKHLQNVFNLLVEDIRTALASLGISLDDIIGVFTTFGDAVGIAIGFISDTASSAINYVRGLFDAFMAIPAVKNNITRLKYAFNFAFGKLPEFFGGLGEKFKTFIEFVKGLGGLTLGNFGEVVQNFKDNVLNYIANFKGFTAIRLAFAKMWGDMKTGLKSIGIDVDGIVETFTGWKDTIVKTVQPHIEAFSKAFTDAFGKLPEFIEGLPAQVESFMEKVQSLDGLSLENATQIFADFKSDIVDYFTNFEGFQGIKDAFTSLKNAIKAKLKVIGFDVDKAKKNISDFVKGITETFSSFKMPKTFQDVIDTINKISEFFTNLFKPKEIETGTDSMDDLRENLKDLGKVGEDNRTLGDVFMDIFSTIAGAVTKLKPGDIIKLGLALFTLKKLSGVIGVFTDIKKVLKAMQQELEARKILELAAAVGIMAAAVGYLSSLEVSDVKSATTALQDIVYMLVVLTIAATKFGGKGESIKNIGVGVVALAGAIVLIVAALKLLEFVNMEGINERLLLLGVIFVSLLGAAKVMSELGGKGVMGTGVGILALVASMYLIIGLIELLSHWHMEFKTAMVALGKLMAIFGLVVLMMAATKLAGEHALGAAAAIAAVGLAFVLIAASMKILETIGPDALARTLICITIIGGIIAGIVYVSKSVDHATGPIIAIGVAFMLLAASLAVLSLLPDPKRLLLATGCLAAVMIVLGLVIGIAGLTKPAMGSMIALAAVIAVMGLVLWGLSSIPSDKLITAAASLSVALLAVSAALFILSLVGKAAVSALVGLGVLAIAIAAFAALAVGLGALADNTDMKKFLDKGIPILEEIAEGFGRFFGKLLGGFIAGIDEASMDEIIDSIVQLGESLKAFGEALDGLPADELQTHAGTIGILVNAINSMDSPIEITNAMGEVIGTDTEIMVGTYTDAIVKLGDALKSFGDAVDDLNPYKLQLHAGVVKALIEYINGMDKTNGIISAIAGYVTDESVSTYTEGIKKLGEGLGEFGKAVKDLDPNTLNLHAETVGDLITYIDKMPKVSGIGEHLALFFDKQPDFDGYSAGFKTLGEGLKGFGEEMAGLDPEKINLHAETVGNLVSYINKMDKESKINNAFLDWFDTEPAIGEYAAGFMKLGIGLSFFGSMLKGLDPVTLGINADTVNTLITTIEGIPKSGGVANAIAEFFTGYTKVDKYKEDMKDLGEGLRNFGNELGGVSVEKLQKAAEASKVLVEVGQGLNGVKLGGWFSDSSYTQFGNEMEQLGLSLQKFANVTLEVEKLGVMAEAANDLAQAGYTLSDLDLEYGDLGRPELVDVFVNNVKTLQALIEELGNTNTDGIETFKSGVEELASTSFGEMGKAAADSAAKGAESKTDAVNASGEGIGNALVSGVGSAEGDMTTAAGSVIDAALSVAESRASDFEPKGRALIEQLAAGMKNSSAAKDAANQVVSDAADAAASSSSISKFYTAGLSMMSKLKEGIDEGGASALRAAAQWADKIQRAFNNIKKPNADKPSGNDPVSEASSGAIDIYTQMVNGYRQNAQNLETALKEFNDAIHTNIDTQPVIRPVLDISDIEVGANAIRDALSNSVAIGLRGNIGAIGNNLTREEDRTGEILDAINAIGKNLADGTGDTYILDGITYDDGSNVAGAIQTLVNSVRMRRRV